MKRPLKALLLGTGAMEILLFNVVLRLKSSPEIKSDRL